MRTRQVFAAAAMPEAAVHEDGDFAARPCEVRLSDDAPVLTVAPEVGGPEQLAQSKFGRGVSARADASHDLRAGFLRDVVHNAPARPLPLRV